MSNANIGGATVTYNGAIPRIGATTLKTELELEPNTKVRVDMTHEFSLGRMTGVQTIFINLHDIKHDVTVHMIDTDQRIVARAGTQGYYPVLSTQIMKFDVSSNSPTAITVDVIFMNFPVAVGVWGVESKAIDFKFGADEPANNKLNVASFADDTVTFKTITSVGDRVSFTENGNDLKFDFTLLEFEVEQAATEIESLNDRVVELEANSGGGGGTPSGGGGSEYLYFELPRVENFSSSTLKDMPLGNAKNISGNANFAINGDGIRITEAGLYMVGISMIDPPNGSGKYKVTVRQKLGKEFAMTRVDQDGINDNNSETMILNCRKNDTFGTYDLAFKYSGTNELKQFPDLKISIVKIG